MRRLKPHTLGLFGLFLFRKYMKKIHPDSRELGPRIRNVFSLISLLIRNNVTDAVTDADTDRGPRLGEGGRSDQGHDN